jgi:hypothetical protein
VIALGVAVELVAAVLLVVGLALGEPRASMPLWASVAVALVGLSIAAIGVARARPPRRSVVAPADDQR